MPCTCVRASWSCSERARPRVRSSSSPMTDGRRPISSPARPSMTAKRAGPSTTCHSAAPLSRSGPPTSGSSHGRRRSPGPSSSAQDRCWIETSRMMSPSTTSNPSIFGPHGSAVASHGPHSSVSMPTRRTGATRSRTCGWRPRPRSGSTSSRRAPARDPGGRPVIQFASSPVVGQLSSVVVAVIHAFPVRFHQQSCPARPPGVWGVTATRGPVRPPDRGIWARSRSDDRAAARQEPQRRDGLIAGRRRRLCS